MNDWGQLHKLTATRRDRRERGPASREGVSGHLALVQAREECAQRGTRFLAGLDRPI